MHSRRSHPSASSLLTALMLFRQLQQMGIFERGRKLPLVTLGLAAASFLLYFFEFDLVRALPALAFSRSAIVPALVAADPAGQWPRLFLAAVRHASETHLYYNIISLLWKGARLEERWGSPRMALTSLWLTGAAGGIMVALSRLLYAFDATREWSDFHTSVVGLSGLLFALKVIVFADPALAGSHASVAAGLFSVSSRWAAWAELAFVQLIMPNVSFLGHLGGILAGMAYLALAKPYGEDAAGAAGIEAWGPLLLLLGPLKWLQRLLSGGGGEGGGNHAGPADGAPAARRRFNHNPEGYVIGNGGGAQDLRRRGGAGGWPAPSAPSMPNARAEGQPEGDDGDVQIVPPPASAPPLSPGGVGVLSPPPSHGGSSNRGGGAVSAGGAGDHYFHEQMAQLYSMGFHDRRANLAALRACGGNVQAAIERML